MGLIDRVKNILIAPKTEWPVIAGESSSTGDLLGGYVAPLAGLSALAGFVGSSLIGASVPFLGTFRVPIVAGIAAAVLHFVFAIVGVFILSLIINALAPTFGGEKNSAQALKVAVYSYTPAWIAGLLHILPVFGVSMLIILISLYGLYLLYVGLPPLMKNPPEKSIGYTAVVVICAIVLSIVLGVVVTAFTTMFGGGMAGMAGMGMGAMRPDRGAAVTFDKDSPMGKLEGFGKKMEEVGKKMEAAEKSGDQQAQMKAAMEGLGAVLGGGKRYEPVQLDALKPLVPESLGGMPRKGQSSERGGIPGLEVAKVQADYGDGASKSIRLQITDTGGAAGLMGLAGWMGVQGEKENDSGIERTRKEGDRLVHEKLSKTGGQNELSVVIGNRFIVEASGRGVSIDELKSAVGSLGLGKLESMKEAGAQK
jgi:uncharacterized membrane protein